ncbi:MAG TPA: hypothetical protein VK492_00350 [Chitinophagaceae bacterium]|nr:hypothetical protein [Chitinophagaceae bacterium]
MPNQIIDSNIIAALIGASISLFVLVVTMFWERWKSVAEIKRNRKKKLIYCAALIKPIISYSDKQSQNIKKFAESLAKDPLKFPLLTFAPKSDLDKFINKVDEQSIFEAYTSLYTPYSKSVKEFKSITSTINYQNLQMDQVLEMVKTSQELDHERKLKLKDCLKSATDLAANSIANQTLQQHPELLHLLDNSLANYLSNRKDVSDLKYAYDAFINPVKQGIVQHQFYQIPVGLQLANFLHEADEIYHDIIMQMDSLKDDFLQICENYAESNDNLKTHSAKLLKDYFDALK